MKSCSGALASAANQNPAPWPCGACLAFSGPADDDSHAKWDAYAKAHGLTIVFAAWHPTPDYRWYRSGTLLSRNDEFPSGLILVDPSGAPLKWQQGTRAPRGLAHEALVSKLNQPPP